jgi:hypothetical protein
LYGGKGGHVVESVENGGVENEVLAVSVGCEC